MTEDVKKCRKTQQQQQEMNLSVLYASKHLTKGDNWGGDYVEGT